LDVGYPALRYRIPSSPMPGTALGEPDSRQPTPPQQSVLGQSVDSVLATGRGESARRQPQRRHHVPVQLDHEDHAVHYRGLGTAHPPPHCLHRRGPVALIRRRPARSSSANRTEPTWRLLGSARTTSCSDRSSSSTNPRATWRNRRANWWRCTAEPTDREMISPTFGASAVVSSARRAYMTRSGWAARVPCFTVAPKSVDRVRRLRAESTALHRNWN
jgi:hypothetical protein